MPFKPHYFITQQMRLFPPMVSSCVCDRCSKDGDVMTVHFYDPVKKRLTCNECGWFPLASDYGGVEVKIR